ncbi:hypothetical protein JCM14469_15610 [Desulfatiferula olefinivorans]
MFYKDRENEFDFAFQPDASITGLLLRRGLLDSWYEFEDKKTKQALRVWCGDNDSDVSETV